MERSLICKVTVNKYNKKMNDMAYVHKKISGEEDISFTFTLRKE